MNYKKQRIQSLRDVFNGWEELLSGTSEEQFTAPQPSSKMSTRDVLVHLWAWQQRTVAKLEAALHGRSPQFPGWPEELGPDFDEDVDRTNAWIDSTYRDKPWPSVYEDWRSQFLYIIEVSERISEEDMLAQGKYPWMGEYPLAAAIDGTHEHHDEHLQEQRAWLSQSAKRNSRK